MSALVDVSAGGRCSLFIGTGKEGGVPAATVVLIALIDVDTGGWGPFVIGAGDETGLATATVAIGTLGSAIAKNQLFAAILGGGMLVFFLLGWLIGQIAESPVSDIFSYVAFFDRHFQPFMRGRINSEGVIFYLSITFAFLLLSTRILQARRQA